MTHCSFRFCISLLYLILKRIPLSQKSDYKQMSTWSPYFLNFESPLTIVQDLLLFSSFYSSSISVLQWSHTSHTIGWYWQCIQWIQDAVVVSNSPEQIHPQSSKIEHTYKYHLKPIITCFSPCFLIKLLYFPLCQNY